jgi:hypothetical protein
MRRGCFVAIGFLYVLSIPWYRTSAGEPAVVLGLPDWVAVALGCYLLAAVLNAVAWLLTVVDDPPPGPADGAERS